MIVDAVVVGGGPAGAAAAATLASHGRFVVLLDAPRRGGVAVGETVPPRFVAEIDRWLPWSRVWSELAVPSYGNRSAWGSDELVSHTFFGTVHGHGFHLDRERFDARLRQAVVDAGVVLQRRQVRAIEDDARGHAVVRLRGDSEPLRTRALVDATGRAAFVARRLGSRPRVVDRLVGLVARHGGCDPRAEGFTQVESFDAGWWFSAPLPDGTFSVALMTDADLLGHPVSATATWSHGLAHAPHTRTRLRGTSMLGSPRAVSAVSQRCRVVASAVPWVATGDAALAVDPLSGSGIVRALRSGHAGGLALAQALDGDGDAIEAHEQELDREFDEYLARRREHYGTETRFGRAPFWQARARA